MLPQLTGIADGRGSEELCASAATMANNLNARAIFVYTRRGYMANFLSRCRPDCPIFAFTGGNRCLRHILLLQLCVLTQVAPRHPVPKSHVLRPPKALWVLGKSALDHADQQDVRQRMNLRWGVMPFRLDFAENPEENIERTFK